MYVCETAVSRRCYIYVFEAPWKTRHTAANIAPTPDDRSNDVGNRQRDPAAARSMRQLASGGFQSKCVGTIPGRVDNVACSAPVIRCVEWISPCNLCRVTYPEGIQVYRRSRFKFSAAKLRMPWSFPEGKAVLYGIPSVPLNKTPSEKSARLWPPPVCARMGI